MTVLRNSENRALSSVGLERYPYKVDVIGSTPIAPTKFCEQQNLIPKDETIGASVGLPMKKNSKI